MIEHIINKLTEDERLLFKSFFQVPGFKRVVKENLERLNAQIWTINVADREDLIMEYEIMKNEHLFWNGLNNLIENVEGTADAPQVQTFDG